jgi:hypothetical protein
LHFLFQTFPFPTRFTFLLFSSPDPNGHVNNFHQLASSSSVRFNILIFPESTGPRGTKLGRVVPYTIYVFGWSEVHKRNKIPKGVKKGVSIYMGMNCTGRVYLLYSSYNFNAVLCKMYIFMSYSFKGTLLKSYFNGL